MIDLASAIAPLAAARPPGLPGVETPELPDLAAAGALGPLLGGDPEPYLRAGAVLEQERGELTGVAAEAAALADGARHDLTALVAETLDRLIRTALPMAMPGNPVAPAAMAEAIGILTDARLRAEERLERLAAELAPLAARLEQVAGRAAEASEAVHEGAFTRPTGLDAAPADAGAATPGGAGGPDAPGAAAGAAGDGEPHDADAVAAAAGGESSESGSAQGEAAVAAARTQLGTPYVWGGTQPGGFDCSGLTQWAYRQAGVEIPRTAEEQAVGRAVSAEELQPGDLAVWDGHVAMYAGDGQMIEAGDPVQTNPVRTSNMGMTFKGFYRPTG